MFTRIRRSYYLFRGSLHVLNQDRELLVFPLLSGFITMIVITTFILPIVWAMASLNEAPMDNVTQGVGYFLLFVFYFVAYAITYYFNTAVVSCAIYRMKGGDPDVRGGFNAARSRFKEILGWALVSASIGLVLKFFQNNSGILGKIAVGLAGVAWSVASYLVIPIIVMEKKGPIDAIKESGRLVKKTWGEQVAGNIGIGFFFFLILLPVVLLIPMLALIQSHAVVLIIITILVVYITLIALVQSTLSTIFQAALYLYAKEDYIPEGFSRSLLRDSVSNK